MLKKTVFISYSSINKSIVRKIYDVLTERGLGCWYYDGGLNVSYTLFGEADNGISECSIFLACCSNSYGITGNSKREILLASERKKLILPILVANCDPYPLKGDIGALLAGKIYLDLSTEENFSKNIEQLIITVNQSL